MVMATFAQLTELPSTEEQLSHWQMVPPSKDSRDYNNDNNDNTGRVAKPLGWQVL